MGELSLNDLAVFVRVVDRGNFASAARELGVPTSTVSRTVARLEATSGTRLLHRTTRSVQPTAEGRDLYAGTAAAVGTLRGAARALEPAARKPRGRLRVTASNDLCAGFLADVIVAFLERYPLVQLDFALTNRRENLVDGGFDVALRAAARLDDSTLVARKLGAIEHRLYASPDYLARHGAPASVEDLHDHRCVVFRAKELERVWALRGAAGEQPVAVRGRVGGDDFTFVRAMVVAGAGVGLMPHLNAFRDEAAGRIVRVLPSVAMRGATLHVVYPSAQHLPPRVAAFRDFVADAFDAWTARHQTEAPAT